MYPENGEEDPVDGQIICDLNTACWQRSQVSGSSRLEGLGDVSEYSQLHAFLLHRVAPAPPPPTPGTHSVMPQDVGVQLALHPRVDFSRLLPPAELLGQPATLRLSMVRAWWQLTSVYATSAIFYSTSFSSLSTASLCLRSVEAMYSCILYINSTATLVDLDELDAPERHDRTE
ncbi:hypothetical protein JG687_00006661 [Phytophthora cactorum]|uniref:Uncharacterized protein n=1 Tax=Phytophthora cactorum TaxID=29920 RepID=A0A8T1UJ00_9STRA|nr:hypothetical protein JG687_00006661 [Phytophthora cactorum]